MTSETGAAAVAMVAVTALLSVLVVATAALAMALAARTQATNAADAAALAAAVSSYPAASSTTPRTVASRMASLHGGRLISCSCEVDGSLRPRTVEVVVGIDVTVPLFGEMEARGHSRAEFDPRRWLGR